MSKIFSLDSSDINNKISTNKKQNKILNDNKKLRRKFLAAYCLSKYNLKQIVFLFSPIHFQQIH